MIQKLILWAAKNPKTEESQLVLNLIEEVENLKKQLEKFKVVAYAKVNDRGDLYDLRLQNNPYVDQNKIIHLYANSEK
jgi:hypothetical protein